MALQTISVDRLTPVIGGVLHGVDLRGPITDEVYTAVHDALLEHQVVFLRDQDIPVEHQIDLGKRFGELAIHPNDPGLEGHPEVMIIHADKDSTRVAGESWHSDVSCDPEPPMATMLRIFKLPATGGDTVFASMYAAFDGLSEPMQRFLETLTATHDGAPYYRSVNERTGRPETGKVYPRATHPVVRTHPETGRKALFVNSMFTTRINELSKLESDALLAMLFNHVQRPDFQCRFRWEPNSIAFWDNRCVQHQAIWDYWPETRTGYRVTVKGDKPY
nr:J214 [uncultured bacterium]